MSWFLTLSSGHTTPDDAPWIPVEENGTGIVAFVNTDTERVLSIMLTQERELLVTYTNYDGTDPTVDWKYLGKFEDDGTVEIVEPHDWEVGTT